MRRKLSRQARVFSLSTSNPLLSTPPVSSICPLILDNIMKREHKQKPFSTFRKLGTQISPPEERRLSARMAVMHREERWGLQWPLISAHKPSLTPHFSSVRETHLAPWAAALRGSASPWWVGWLPLRSSAQHDVLLPLLNSPLCHHGRPQRPRWMPLPPVYQAQLHAYTAFISVPLEDLRRSIQRTTEGHNEALKTECSSTTSA